MMEARRRGKKHVKLVSAPVEEPKLSTLNERTLEDVIAEIHSEIAIAREHHPKNFEYFGLSVAIVYYCALLYVVNQTSSKTFIENLIPDVLEQRIDGLISFTPKLDEMNKSFIQIIQLIKSSCGSTTSLDDCLETLELQQETKVGFDLRQMLVRYIKSTTTKKIDFSRYDLGTLYQMFDKTREGFFSPSQLPIFLKLLSDGLMFGAFLATTCTTTNLVAQRSLRAVSMRFNFLLEPTIDFTQCYDKNSAELYLGSLRLKNNNFGNSEIWLMLLVGFALIGCIILDIPVTNGFIPFVAAVAFIQSRAHGNIMQIRSAQRDRMLFAASLFAESNQHLDDLGFTLTSQLKKHRSANIEYVYLELNELDKKVPVVSAFKALQSLIKILKAANIPIDNFSGTRCYISAGGLRTESISVALLDKWINTLKLFQMIAIARAEMNYLANKLKKFGYLLALLSYPEDNPDSTPTYRFIFTFINKVVESKFIACMKPYGLECESTSAGVMLKLDKSLIKAQDADQIINEMVASLEKYNAVKPLLSPAPEVSVESKSLRQDETVVADISYEKIPKRKHGAYPQSDIDPIVDEQKAILNDISSFHYHGRDIELYRFHDADRYNTSSRKPSYVGMGLSPSEVGNDGYFNALKDTLAKGRIAFRENEQGMVFVNRTMTVNDQSSLNRGTLPRQFPVVYNVKTLGMFGRPRAFMREIEQTDKRVFLVCATDPKYHERRHG